MNFAFFESLTRPEAQDYLANFLSETSRGLDRLAAEAQADGLTVDYSIESVAPLMLWVFPQLQTVPRPENPAVPAWIRQANEYAEGLYDFTESARIFVLRTAFYFGQAFVRTFPGLQWGVGDEDYAQKHMPVVRGFKSDLELPPLLVAENLYGRLIADRSTSECIDTAVEYWRRNVEV